MRRLGRNEALDYHREEEDADCGEGRPPEQAENKAEANWGARATPPSHNHKQQG